MGSAEENKVLFYNYAGFEVNMIGNEATTNSCTAPDIFTIQENTIEIDRKQVPVAQNFYVMRIPGRVVFIVTGFIKGIVLLIRLGKV